MLRETPSPTVVRLLTGHERRTHNRCWRQHGTATPLLVHTRSGRAVVRVPDDDEPRVLSPGHTVLWFPGVTQDFGTVDGEPWEIVWAHFHPRERWHGWLGWPMLGEGVARSSTPPERQRQRIDDALMEMDAYARSGLPHASDFAVNALERVLLWIDAANPGPTRLGEPVQEAVLFISRHLDQRLSVRDVAEAVHLSPSRLAHLFKQQTGHAPARFIEHRRMERAQTLLDSTSLSIGAVSAAVGFSNQFHFAARFRTVSGTSPSEWRRRARGP